MQLTSQRLQKISAILKCGSGKIKLNCPLPNHNEKTPSCYVQKEFFKCFGCGEGGDIFKFIEMVQNCDFNEAVKRLADRAGIVPETNDWVGGTGGEDKRKDLFSSRKNSIRDIPRSSIRYE